MPKHGPNKKCTRYLGERRRIKNKTRQQEKRIKKMTKEISKENMLRDSKIGRTKEGFSKEAFKFKKRKNENISSSV